MLRHFKQGCKTLQNKVLLYDNFYKNVPNLRFTRTQSFYESDTHNMSRNIRLKYKNDIINVNPEQRQTRETMTVADHLIYIVFTPTALKSP